ncbi:MAG TPA: peptidylprolyl isomerase [Pirellulales bacterium]|nr:peptidylprolyl isomerase [Pirellulales bacterium]
MAGIIARGDDKHPIIVLHTSMGDMVLRLDAEKAPRTVYNFMSYAASGHYNDTIFHQVEPGYAVLGGGYTAELEEKPGRYPIRNEASPTAKNQRGTIAMAHAPSDPDSATCQFFINLADNSSLDYQSDDAQRRGYCVFGEVIEGLQVLETISQVKVHSVKQFPSVPQQAVTIKAVTRLR